MEIKQLSIKLMCYEHLDELSAPARASLQRAVDTLPEAYAPYSRFRVAAAVYLSNGEIVAAANTENAAYPQCLCAERAALAAAASRYAGVAPVLMAITVANAQRPVLTPAAPCGSCRQVLVEQEERYGQSMAIVMRGEQGMIYQVDSAKDLLPLSFSGAFL